MKNAKEQRDPGGRFLMGHNGGPGRPKGSRNKLAQEYIDGMYLLWQEGGIEAARKVRDQEPAKFLAAIANLIPQHFKFEHEHKVVLSEEEIERRLIELATAVLDEQAGAVGGVPAIAGGTRSNEGEKEPV